MQFCELEQWRLQEFPFEVNTIFSTTNIGTENTPTLDSMFKNKNIHSEIKHRSTHLNIQSMSSAIDEF